MSKTDGIGVLSLSLEFLHVKRWPCASGATPKPPGGAPTVFVAVNFDDPAPLEADVTEFPAGNVTRRAHLAAHAGLWHGMRLTSIQDILHVDVHFLETSNARESPPTDPVASFSGPVTSFLEEAFLQSDARGARRTFELGGASATTAQFRVKFHLQEDILRALYDGLDIEMVSADSIERLAPHAVSLCGAAETLAAARRGRRSGRKSFDDKAAAQEREESAAFRRRAKHDVARADVAREQAERVFERSHAALTASVKRFIASKRSDGASDERPSNLVRLLSDAR